MIELIAIIIVGITVVGLFFIVYHLLNVLENIAKLIKADNLQEYIIGNEIAEEKIEIGQADDRYQDVADIPEDKLSSLKINPGDIGKENFN